MGRDARERARLERQVQTWEHEVQRLIDAYQVGAIALTEWQDRRQRSEEHRHVLMDRLQELHRQRHAREQEIRLLQGLEGFCASLREALVDPSFAVKQKVLQLVVDLSSWRTPGWLFGMSFQPELLDCNHDIFVS